MKWFRNFEAGAFFKNLYEKALETDLFGNAAQVAFYFSFAFFPLLLFLVTLFGMVLGSTESLQAELNLYLAQLLPTSAYELVRTTMTEIIESSSGGKLTLGAIVTLWSASAGVDSLRGALNSVYETDEDRPWWKTKLQSLVVTLMFIILLGIAVTALATGWQMFERMLALFNVQAGGWLLSILQWIGIATVMVLATAVIYSWLPSFEEFRWVWVSPGSVFAIILWVALTGGFRIYLQYFNSYNKAYGSLGAVIILMLWMYLTGMALLIGGAINSVLTEMSEGSGAREAQLDEEEHQIKELRKRQAAKR